MSRVVSRWTGKKNVACWRQVHLKSCAPLSWVMERSSSNDQTLYKHFQCARPENLLSKKNSIEKYSFVICFPLMASAVVYKCQETLLLLDGKLKAVARPDWLDLIQYCRNRQEKFVIESRTQTTKWKTTSFVSTQRASKIIPCMQMQCEGWLEVRQDI